MCIVHYDWIFGKIPHSFAIFQLRHEIITDIPLQNIHKSVSKNHEKNICIKYYSLSFFINFN